LELLKNKSKQERKQALRENGKWETGNYEIWGGAAVRFLKARRYFYFFASPFSFSIFRICLARFSSISLCLGTG